MRTFVFSRVAVCVPLSLFLYDIVTLFVNSNNNHTFLIAMCRLMLMPFFFFFERFNAQNTVVESSVVYFLLCIITTFVIRLRVMLGVLRRHPQRCGVPEENLRNAGKDQQTLVDFCVWIFLSWSQSELSKIWDILFCFCWRSWLFSGLFFWEVVKIMAGLTISRIIVQIASKAA